MTQSHELFPCPAQSHLEGAVHHSSARPGSLGEGQRCSGVSQQLPPCQGLCVSMGRWEVCARCLSELTQHCTPSTFQQQYSPSALFRALPRFIPPGLSRTDLGVWISCCWIPGEPGGISSGGGTCSLRVSHWGSPNLIPAEAEEEFRFMKISQTPGTGRSSVPGTLIRRGGHGSLLCCPVPAHLQAGICRENGNAWSWALGSLETSALNLGAFKGGGSCHSPKGITFGTLLPLALKGEEGKGNEYCKNSMMFGVS